MGLYEEVGTRLRDLRSGFAGGKGLSQEELARKVGVTANTISRWETATYHPDLDDLEKLARALGVSILDLLPTDDVKPQDQLKALLRAAQGLSKEDIVELQRYAEYRRGRAYLAHGPRGRSGRKTKES
jgi:DNA-binding XRE family transcriptional regulator